MAIDPVLPVTPSHPALSPVGAPADSAAALLARAQAALAEGTALLGDMVDGSVGAPEAAERADAGRKAAPLSATPPPETPVADRLAAAVRSASALAAPCQNGLAPLMADLSVALERADTPPPVRQAARGLLDIALPTNAPVTPTVLREAVRRSGVFLEAALARGLAHGGEGPGAAALPRAAPSGDLKAALLVFRSVVATWVDQTPQTPQTPSGPSVPSEQARAGPTPQAEGRMPSLASTPSARPAPAGPIAEASSAVPAAEPSAAPDPDVALEPNRVQRPPSALTAQASVSGQGALDPPEVAESAGLAARSAGTETPRLPTSLGSPGPERPQMATPQSPVLPMAPSPSPPPTTAAAVMLMAGLVDDERHPARAGADEPALQESPEALRSRPGPRPPPPYAGGPTSAQPARPSDLPKDLAPGDLARRLLKDVGAALARQELSQIASLPEARAEGRPEPDRPVESRGARWVMDLPFQTPQGVAVAQFEISRDGGGGGASGGGEIERTWRARFSLDVEPLGPVHVQVALTGAQTRVSLWAERPEAMARLKAGEETLSAALRQADLTPEVAVHAGAPHRAPSAPGRFVDRAS